MTSKVKRLHWEFIEYREKTKKVKSEWDKMMKEVDV